MLCFSVALSSILFYGNDTFVSLFFFFFYTVSTSGLFLTFSHLFSVMNLSLSCRIIPSSFPSVRRSLSERKFSLASRWLSAGRLSTHTYGSTPVNITNGAKAYVIFNGAGPGAVRTYYNCSSYNALVDFRPDSFEARKISSDTQNFNSYPDSAGKTLTKEEDVNPLTSIEPDRWRGIGIDSSLHCRQSVDKFRRHLDDAIVHWHRSGIRPITAKIRKEESHHIPALIGAGFEFHHAQPGYVYLKRWLAEEEPDSFPAYANHYLGVAGFVVDEESDEMLVIKERFAPKPMWKLPGGTADSGEDLHQIAIREVKEETGIETEFVGVVCFRHMHNFRYGCSDFYFICHLRPITKEIKIDESEILDCCWMKVDDYLENQAPTAMNKHFVQCYKDYLKQDKFSGVIGKKAVHHHINKIDYNVYSIFRENPS